MYTPQKHQLEGGPVSFWATVCKTVRPMLSDRCPVCPVCNVVYCGQTVGWIKMKLGVKVGLGHIVLDGNPAPPKKGHSPSISGPCLLFPTAGWITMPLGTEVGISPNDIVLDGDRLATIDWAENCCAPFRGGTGSPSNNVAWAKATLC